MKLDSKYFDTIRVRRRSKAAEKAKVPDCAWDGLRQAGDLQGAARARPRRAVPALLRRPRAPVQQVVQLLLGPERPGHPVLSEGLADRSPADLEDGRGRRGSRGGGAAARCRRRAAPRARDPFNLFEDGTPRPQGATRAKKVRSLEAKALKPSISTEEAGGEAIRTRYKSLVKQCTPTPMAGTADTRTGCARSFRPTSS